MISLKTVDRIALAAMFTASVAVSVASLLPLSAHAASPSVRVMPHRGLTEDLAQQIRAGMHEAEVLALIGPPRAKMRFEATKTTSWDYSYQDSWNYDSEFSTIFNDDGVVVSKVHVRNGQ